MLSYQHIYHAGCFADVVKHIVLTRLLNYLTQKDKPLFYMETHAGRGLYDLQSSYAQKTGESLAGIQLLWQSRQAFPTLCSPYMDIIQQVNQAGSESEVCRFYPGSPYYAQQQLRPMDRMILCEKHPQEFMHLEAQFKREKRAFCIQTDGIQHLKAALPPKEKRGLIFIDPSFELKNEYQDIPEAVKSVFKRFSTGTYCLWYPILDYHLRKQWLNRLTSINAAFLCVEFKHKQLSTPGMSACGLWVINPPYLLQQELKDLAPIWKALSLNMDISTCINDIKM